MKKSITIMLVILSSVVLYSQRTISLDSIDIVRKGDYIKICDKVTDVFKPEGEKKNTYINFGGHYPDHKFTVVIFASDYPHFTYTPVEYLKDKNICVTGIVSVYKDKPEIIAKKEQQIEIVGGES
ncbi:MAG: hypothetical protein R2771_04425 [Saprospiraceae bacterium]